MSFWAKPAEFGNLDPVVGGELRIYRPTSNYAGPVISQGLNVSDIGGKTLTVGMDLAKVFGASTSASVHVTVEFTRPGGIRQEAAVLQPLNSGVGATFSRFSGTFTFPSDALKLIKTSVEITDNASFKADNLALSGPFTANPVPIIANVSPGSVAYHNPVTITGSGFGSTSGTLSVGGSAANLVVDSWADSQIVFHLLNPHHGGRIHLEADDVMASQTPAITVSSPHFVLATAASSVLAVPGQVVELNTWLTFYQGYVATQAIQLAVPGATAVFSPHPVVSQGGSRLRIDTSGLAPGPHAFVITSADGPTPGNSVPLTIDVRLPGSLELSIIDPNSLTAVPVTGTLGIDSHAALETTYLLRNTAGQNLTSGGTLEWQSSNPAVLQLKPGTGGGDGPTLYPQANGTCNLTATAVNGFTKSIPVQIAIGTPGIVSIGFTTPVMDNTGSGPLNRFQASTNGFSSITSLSHSGFQAVNAAYQFGTTGTMDFRVPTGLAPGQYEFTAENNDIFSPVRRSALLTVTNATGTGLLKGGVYRASTTQTLGAGTMEFYRDDTLSLAFTRPISTNGAFLLGAIPPGSYRLRFVPTPKAGETLDSPWYPNATRISDAGTVTITADATTPDIHFFVFDSTLPPAVELALPRIVSLSHSGQAFTLSFMSTSGLKYLIETKDSLTAGVWTPLETVAGDGGLKVVTDPAATGAGKFYRIAVSAQ